GGAWDAVERDRAAHARVAQRAARRAPLAAGLERPQPEGHASARCDGAGTRSVKKCFKLKLSRLGAIMNIVCIGGGPSGLYFALLMKQQNPEHQITVIERNKPYDTFGWGVVFSDQTLGNLQAADPQTAGEILGAFNHWDDIEVNIRGHQIRS